MAENPNPTGKKVLRVGALSRLGTLDPRQANDTISSMILNEIFESPYSSPFGTETPEPRLFAEPLRREGGSQDRPIHSAAVRKGILFSDGTPLTPDIVARSLMSSRDFTEQASADARAERIFFTLQRPNPRFELVLTTNFSSIVLEKGGSLIGTGPFMFPQQSSLAQLQRLDTLTLVRNPHYRDSVELAEIRFSIFPASSGGGTEMLLEAAKRGEIDFTYSLTSVDAAALQGLPFVPSIGTGNATGLLHFNTTRPGLNDPEVRQAIAYAIDRRKIAEATYERNPLAYAAPTLLPPLMGRDPQTTKFDLAKAKEIAARAGAKMPKRLNLMLLWSPRPYIPNPKRAGELIRDQLAEIGIAIDFIVPADRNEYFDRVRRGNYDLIMGGWIADTADPADFFEALLLSRAVPSPTNDTTITNNVSRWVHPPMDLALARFRTDPTEANRAEVMKMLVDQAPFVPLIYGQAVAVYSRNVQGFRASPLGRVSLASLQIR
ncbi:MAG TPA: ABC transporter substrate-binding protein [Thermoanaerobaculia bacterium]|nr:ABC transporter substrate-binding protein [Thermoanaerobaculia bacterium]